MYQRVYTHIILFIPLFVLYRGGEKTKQLSFYYGQTYRLNNNFYSSFDIYYEHFKSSCTRSSYKGYGIRFDNFRNKNYALSLKYFHSLLKRPDLSFSPYCSISPVYFKSNNTNGMNIKPELGLLFNTAYITNIKPFSISLNISYGYDIPIVNEKAFSTNRHDISAKIAITVCLTKTRVQNF